MDKVQIYRSIVEDGQIYVRIIKNVMSPLDIAKLYGKEVLRIYEKGPHYYRTDTCDINYYNPTAGSCFYMCVGDLYDSDVFSWYLEQLAEAGELLESAIKRASSYSRETVEV